MLRLILKILKRKTKSEREEDFWNALGAAERKLFAIDEEEDFNKPGQVFNVSTGLVESADTAKESGPEDVVIPRYSRSGWGHRAPRDLFAEAEKAIAILPKG